MPPKNTSNSRGQQNVEAQGNIRREKPWLYPYNRRLRHLQGISIRNISLATPQLRPRGASIDDEALPYSKKSPSKSLAVHTHKPLEHSRSQTNLRPIKESDSTTSLVNLKPGKENAIEDGEITTPPRPGLKSMRRRSTLEWIDASPHVRQKKLEDIFLSRMVDMFFSLHAHGLEDPIYISEPHTKVMNPDFRFFNLSEIGPSISRLDELTIKVWAKTDTMSDYKFFIDMTVPLRSLQFLGKSMANWDRPLPANCILFHMKDGVYTAFTDIPPLEPSVLSMETPQRALANQVLPSSSYDALMKLSTLDDCVQDALQTRFKLEREINEILENNRENMETIRLVAVKTQKLDDINDAITAEKKALNQARKRRDDLRTQLSQRKSLMQSGCDSIKTSSLEMEASSQTITALRETLTTTAEEITGQRRRICEDLLRIYPIDPFPHKPLSFTIRNLPLPNAEFEDVDEEVTAAALGHVAHIVDLLQHYLAIPLPYPITVKGSTSLIEDPISNTSGSRTYPLFLKGAIKYRFEFGVFLLNKNIEILSNHVGLRFMDPRQMLPNLKYLLYVATAGKGEIPARKAGGIRGFLRSEGGLGSALSSRRGSQESGVSETIANGKQSLVIKQGGQKPQEVKGKSVYTTATAQLGKNNGALKSGYANVRAGSKLRDVS
ncbi:hypothetical protein EJ08DRAFT_377635 [Tothia fuscella]|uniref:Autophagy-related protein 14 n=1 Tax=Tothia fuscella TaxID=1048955 RepID=A0A9P4NLB5_9PEZI|nr:hypothetical protein EJ08DRAFT_377635 [Tothia fuscella]